MLALSLKILSQILHQQIGKQNTVAPLRPAITQDFISSNSQHPTSERAARIILIELNGRNPRHFLQQVVRAMRIAYDRSNKSSDNRLCFDPMSGQRLPRVGRQLTSWLDIL